ncbi:low affinity immunoglobulin gamma Fc region receptor III-A-like [Odontesthes bonariensis]|uniref:low affinity immunoglobulin gamma Fc region receptor III-A-like n=1 Tax=Odontesthes bonariensis TaxID=219752 RepID=UPI003F5819DA
MDVVISLLVLSSLPLLVVPEVPTVTSFRATVEIVSGNSRVFSGGSVRLRCSVPVSYSSDWNFWWFRGSTKLPQTGELLTLWNANVKESGKFSCHGVRDSVVGIIKTLRSLPVEINVDGGFAILRASPQTGLVGETLNFTCHLRVNLPLHETILYKDDIEVMRQNGNNRDFYLTNVTLQDEGMYSFRASWDRRGRTHSVMSVATPVHILEVLTQPLLEIDAGSDPMKMNRMKLICHVQYNARAPAPPLNYYFYKSNTRMGMATSEKHFWVSKTPGQYSCRARVPLLGLSRFSETKDF